MSDVGDFKLDYPIREWVPGHWKDEEPVAKRNVIYNLGLPRTGTTSVETALTAMGFRARRPIATSISRHEPRLELPEDILYAHPLICTVRPVEEWLDSAYVYFGSATMPFLEDMYHQHQQWTVSLNQPVGFFDVHEGYSGLFRALARAFDGGRALPHENQRSTLR